MSSVTQQDDFTAKIVPAVKWFTIVESPLRWSFRHQVYDILDRLVEPCEVVVDVLTIADGSPALHNIRDFVLGLGDKGDNVELLIARDGEDQKVPVFSRPEYAVTLKRPIGE
jgi:hypothetical protein